MAVRGSVLTRFRDKHLGCIQMELLSLKKDNKCLHTTGTRPTTFPLFYFQKSMFRRVK